MSRMEVGGIEPPSEKPKQWFSTRLVADLISSYKLAATQYCKTSSISFRPLPPSHSRRTSPLNYDLQQAADILTEDRPGAAAAGLSVGSN